VGYLGKFSLPHPTNPLTTTFRPKAPSNSPPRKPNHRRVQSLPKKTDLWPNPQEIFQTSPDSDEEHYCMDLKEIKKFTELIKIAKGPKNGSCLLTDADAPNRNKVLLKNRIKESLRKDIIYLKGRVKEPLS
jgi:hypothetical protein